MVHFSRFASSIQPLSQRTCKRSFGCPCQPFFSCVCMILISTLFVFASSCNSTSQYWRRSFKTLSGPSSALSSEIVLFLVRGLPGRGGSIRSWRLSSLSWTFIQNGPALPCWKTNDCVSPTLTVRSFMPRYPSSAFMIDLSILRCTPPNPQFIL